MAITGKKRSVACAAGTLLGCCAAANVAAERASTEEQDRALQELRQLMLQDVETTALRRATQLQQTPVSVGVVSGDRLLQKGALDFVDFASAVPGFTILDNGPGQRRPIIRGIAGAGEPTVGVYYEEFPIASTPGATNDAGRFTPDIKLIDVQQVQVLRGPQGSLFGAGSEGGTLQTLFRRPDLNTFSAAISSDAGTVAQGGNNLLLSAVTNVPLVEGVLGVRFAGYRTNDGGFIDNAVLGTRDLNDGHTAGGRMAMRYVPAERLTLDLLALYHRAHYQAGYQSVASAGDLQSDVPAFDPFEDEVRLFGLTGRYRSSLALLTANASWYARDVFFNFTFPNLAIPWQYSEAQGLAPYSNGQPTVGASNAQQPQNVDARTFELRLSAPEADSVLQWTLGGFYQDRSAYVRSVLPYVGADGRPDPIYPLFVDRTILTGLDQRAAYGEISYLFFGKLTATAGGRWGNFSASSDSAYRVNPGGSPGANTYSGLAFSDDKFVKKLNLAWQFDERLMGYATYSEGFRAGGANQTAVNQPTYPAGYGADTVKNYELGLKSRWFDKRIAVNADAYRMGWDNIQIQGTTPDGLYRFIANAGAAKVEGVEFEARGRAVQGLELGLTYGWTFARLTKDKPFNPGLRESGYAGDRLPNVPRHAGNVFAEYARPIRVLTMLLYAEYQYVGRSQNLLNPYLTDPTSGAITTSLNPGFAYIPAYSAVNLRAGVASDRWSVSLYVRNAGNTRGERNVRWDSPFTPGRYTFYLVPRTFGLTAGVKF